MDTSNTTTLERIAEAVRVTSRRLVLMGFGADVISVTADHRYVDGRVEVRVQADTHAGTNRIANYLRCSEAIVSEGTLIYASVNAGPLVAVGVYGPAADREPVTA
jgi:hypothetical protein